MKLLSTFCATVLLGAFALAAPPAAQAQVNVNVNLGRPAWGPAVPREAQYYYIPEIDGYYDLYSRQYIVFRHGQWLPVAVLDGYNPYAFHPVVLDYRGRQPWVYVRDHRDRYRPVVVVQGHGGKHHGLPPGQAKKLYREGYGAPVYLRADDRDDRRYYDRDGDDHGKHGKGRDWDRD